MTIAYRFSCSRHRVSFRRKNKKEEPVKEAATKPAPKEEPAPAPAASKKVSFILLFFISSLSWITEKVLGNLKTATGHTKGGCRPIQATHFGRHSRSRRSNVELERRKERRCNEENLRAL